MPFLNSPLVYPDYARVDGAWSEVQHLPDTFFPNLVTYTPLEGHIDLLINITFQGVTGGTAGGRLGIVAWQLSDGGQICVVSAPTTQGASAVFEYSFVYGLASAFVTATGLANVGLPHQLIYPTMHVLFGLSPEVAGDSVTSNFVTVIHVPTDRAAVEDWEAESATRSNTNTPLLVT